MKSFSEGKSVQSVAWQSEATQSGHVLKLHGHEDESGVKKCPQEGKVATRFRRQQQKLEFSPSLIKTIPSESCKPVVLGTSRKSAAVLHTVKVRAWQYVQYS